MKVAFVTPRYGAAITSGAGHTCRLLAEQLATRHDVEVLTTTALDDTRRRSDECLGADAGFAYHPGARTSSRSRCARRRNGDAALDEPGEVVPENRTGA